MFYPYDHTPARVKSYVAMAGAVYLGILTADRDQPFQVVPADGRRSGFPRTLAEAARLLTSARAR